VSNPLDLAAIFLRWVWLRALLHRGWWLVTSVYLVIDAGLSPAQLVLIGAAQGAVMLTFEVPAGVLADTVSRKWSLVVSHVLMGTAMIATGLVTDFEPLLLTQMLWGLSWTFASGADVAWITDELDQPKRISGVLVRSGRADLLGAAVGIVAFGALAALTERSTAMVLAGTAMLLLGLYVVVRFRERNFVPASTKRWSASYAVLKRGLLLARHSRAILVMFAATFLVNGATEVGRLFQKRLIDIGLPSDPVVWFMVLGIITLFVGAAALRVVEHRIEGVRTAQLGYVLACLAGVAGLVVLAIAPEELSGSAAILFVSGIAVPLTRTLSTIWVNRQTSGDVRATVHSFLAQSEYLGEIVFGVGIAAVARIAGLSPALIAGGALFAIAMLLVLRVDASRSASTDKPVDLGIPVDRSTR
jgi:MFS family permease